MQSRWDSKTERRGRLLLFHHILDFHRRVPFVLASVCRFHKRKNLNRFFRSDRSDSGFEKFHNLHNERHVPDERPSRSLSFLAPSQSVKSFVLPEDSFATPFPHSNNLNFS